MLTNAKARLSQCSELSIEDRIDAICDCFEQDWNEGTRPGIDSYLEFCDPTDQPRLLSELLSVDWELRTRNGEHPSWDEYLSKLPQFADQIEATKFKHQADIFNEVTRSMNGRDLSRIAHFELIEKIGSGATGDVWKARDTRLQRIVAVKIPRAVNLSEDERSRFLREGRATAELKHPNIVAVHEVNCADGTPYIVSDFIAGQDLRCWLKQVKPSHRQAAKLCLNIARALTHAHRQEVVHRDLKPANILLDEDGVPHIVDFGLAKRASSNASVSTQRHLIGTPAYMSPEQAKGELCDARSDVYSLGIMLYEMIVGQQPFVGNLDEVICAVLTKEPTLPRRLNHSIPRDLELICLKAIAKQPADRYQSAEELAEDLQSFLNGVPIQSRRYRTVALAWHVVRRKLLTMALPTAIIVATFMGWKLMPAKWAIAPSLEPRSVWMDTVPSGAKVIFVPISPSDGEPVRTHAIKASGLTPVRVDLAPGDYWVESLLPDGRFHDVLRHVPRHREQSTRTEKHLRWIIKDDGSVELPEMEIPSKDVVKKMMLVDTSKDSTATNPGTDLKRLSQMASFYVCAEEVTMNEYERRSPSLPSYLLHAQLQSNQPIPLTYDDAVSYAEGVGMRLPARSEWQHAQNILPARSANQLAVWTTTYALGETAIKVLASEESEDHLQLAVGGSNLLIRQDGLLQTKDYDAKNWAGLQRGRFYPGVGLLCVRSVSPQFFRDK